jgi:hypothetical protein
MRSDVIPVCRSTGLEMDKGLILLFPGYKSSSSEASCWKMIAWQKALDLTIQIHYSNRENKSLFLSIVSGFKLISRKL